jgi:hypothetical protein
LDKSKPSSKIETNLPLAGYVYSVSIIALTGRNLISLGGLASLHLVVSIDNSMPKAVKGALLQCDPPQMAMVRKIDRETNNAYIIEEIDDHTCLVKENKVEEIKAKVKELMDVAMGVDDDDHDDKDSDLD